MINIDTRLLDQVSSDQFWLLCHIIKRADNNNACYPSNKTLCSDTGWNIKKLQKIKTELIDGGLLIVSSRVRKEDNKQGSNWYSIRTDLMGIYVPAKRLDVLLQDTLKSDTLPGNRVAPPTPKRDNEVLTNSEVLSSPNGDDSKKPVFDTESSGQLSLDGRTSEPPSKKVVPAEKSQKEKKVPRENDVLRKSFIATWERLFPTIPLKFPRDGKMVNELIDQCRVIMAKMGVPVDDEKVSEFFDIAMQNLPDWYRGKTMPIINSHFPTIIDQIANGKAKPTLKNSADQFSRFAGFA